ncbi:MAG TPA: UDP-N-acetylmuramoyl-tripeptide--D-alanyl-D-alanine ligase [Clostridiaceae bacterium]|nr:UDP-N-acetylmuramoyl-tripeptide--D-alanyl-D-alanine ligase [Clostridiaceae bacterium]
MTRFLPTQIKLWTDGELLQTEKHAEDSERYYPSISTDTRSIKRGEVFVPLRGDHFDGHHFLHKAYERGAGMLVIACDAPEKDEFVSLLETDEDAPDILIVEDTWKAYQDIASGYRTVLEASVIGVTGSVGKTTTRRMIYCMIESQVRAEQSQRNYNNQVGLPRTILATNPKTQALVAELGMDRKGEIRTLSHISRPDISIITGVGVSHAEYLGSMRDILEEKISVMDGMKSNGLLLLNGDDALLENWAVSEEPEISHWYICSEKNVGRLEREGIPVFWAENVRIDSQGLSFIGRSNLTPDERWPIYLTHPGLHLIPAVLFGLAVVYAMGLNMQEAAASARNFTTSEHRQELFRSGAVDIIDDTYNSSPESLQSALRTASMMAGGRRRLVAVIGGMRELGRYSKEAHLEAMNELSAADVDRVFLIGDETKVMRDAMLSDHLFQPMFAGWYETGEEAIPDVLDEVHGDDLVLVKASRYYELDHVVTALVERKS